LGGCEDRHADTAVSDCFEVLVSRNLSEIFRLPPPDGRHRKNRRIGVDQRERI